MQAMQRTSVLFPADLLEELAALSKQTGAPVAELHRRACRAYVDQHLEPESALDVSSKRGHGLNPPSAA